METGSWAMEVEEAGEAFEICLVGVEDRDVELDALIRRDWWIYLQTDAEASESSRSNTSEKLDEYCQRSVPCSTSRVAYDLFEFITRKPRAMSQGVGQMICLLNGHKAVILT